MRSRTLFILITLISFLFSTQTPAIADNPPRRILSGWLPDYSLSRNLPTVEGNLDLTTAIGLLPSNNTNSYGDLMGKLDTIIELLKAEKYSNVGQ